MKRAPYFTKRGFTLIELLIVVAVIAMIAAFAIPNYTEYVRRGYRVEAMSALMNATAQLQQRFTINNSYVKPAASTPAKTAETTETAGATGAAGTTDTAATPPPEAFKGTEKYRVILNSSDVTATTFLLKAEPVSGYSDSKCGTFTINETGTRGLESNTDTVANCWAGK